MFRLNSVKRGLTILTGIACLATVSLAQTVPSGNPLLPGGNPSNSTGTQDDEARPTSRSSATTISNARSFDPDRIDTSGELIDESRLSARNSGLGSDLRTNPPKPGEFEEYVESLLGRPLPRFGSELLLPSNRDFATPATATVPPDYILNVGDVVSIALTGSVEGSVDREIDTDGKIFLPKVGAIHLAGIRYADLRDQVSAAIGRQYRGYDVTVGIRRLRGLRVYVTGFANNPGAFTVSSLSTIANAVFSAGGPSSGGSFRSVKLYRRGQEVADFDLYQLVRGGNRINDAVLQNEDVLFIPPAGPQVAVIGSVNAEAIYEAKEGESLEDLLQFAGGTNSMGDRGQLILYRTADPNLTGPQHISRSSAPTIEAARGDILQILSKGTLTQPVARQSVLVRIEGEVNRPGNYFVAPNTPLANVVELAGGLSPRAFPFGTKMTRRSVREQQRESYAEAIKQLELTLAAAPLTADTSQSSADRQLQLAGARQVLDRLKEAEPDGRIVLQIDPSANNLPGEVLLENNDNIFVPPRSTTVGVFGAVYRPASFLLDEQQRPLRVKDYIDRAGGTLRAADEKGIFVVRANGEVLPRRRGALSARVLPGDIIFIPVKTQGGSFWTKLREISTVLFQAGLSAATIGNLTK